MLLHTAVCDLLGCDYPVVLAGMGGVARSALVAAVSEAGGFGFLGMVRETPKTIREEIARTRERTMRPFGVNLIPAATAPDLFKSELATCLAQKVAAVTLFWDLDIRAVQDLREAGILVLCQIGSPREAEAAQRAGAQILIAQGVEAGGHVRGTSELLPLLRDVVANVDVPVLAAGGLSSGKDLVAALAQGAQGIVMGTAFLATTESFAHDYHKQRIVEAPQDATLRTDIFHVNWPRGAFVRVLQSSVTRGERGDPFSGEKREIAREIGPEGDRPIFLFSTDSPQQNMTGDFEAMALYAGEASGRIEAIVSAAERLGAVVSEASRLLGETPENASPICYAKDADETYMGFASRDELLALLNELLEAERAGARVTAMSAATSDDPAMKSLMQMIWRDEAASCAMLRKWIARLGGEASPKIGDFYEKCLAISDTGERARFLNRGQGWVARKLREALPRLRDDAMHADFKTMLQSHEANIARTNAVLEQS